MEVKRFKRKKLSGMAKLSKLVNSLSGQNLELRRKQASVEQRLTRAQGDLKLQNELLCSIEDQKNERLIHIEYLTSQLEMKSQGEQKEMKETIAKLFEVIKNDQIKQLIGIWKERREAGVRQSANENVHFVEYLQKERLVLDEDLRRKTEEMKKLSLGVEVQENSGTMAINEERAEEEVETEGELLANVIQEQAELLELMQQHELRRVSDQELISSKDKEIGGLQGELAQSKSELTKAVEENQAWQQKDLMKKTLVKEYQKQTQKPGNGDEIADFLTEIGELKKKVRSLEEEKEASSGKRAQWEVTKKEQDEFIKESERKNSDLRQRVFMLGRMLGGKTKDVGLLVCENTKLRKELYLAQGEFINPLEVIGGKVDSETEALFMEIQSMLRKNRELEERVSELEVEKHSMCQRLSSHKRAAPKELEVAHEKTQLKKVKVAPSMLPVLPVMMEQKVKEGGVKAQAKTKTQAKCNCEVNQLVKKTGSVAKDLFTEEIQELLKANRELKGELQKSKIKGTELRAKVAFLETHEEKQLEGSSSGDKKNELLAAMKELIEIEKETKETILKRHEHNLSKFVKQLESKIELETKERQSGTAIEIESPSKPQKPQGESRHRSKEVKRVNYREFFELVNDDGADQSGWDKLEDLYMGRLAKFDKDPTKRLSEREIFFIDSPYYFLERLLTENRELLVELKQMEGKMREIVGSERLRSVMRENRELRGKLVEFTAEKKELDAVKDQLREVFTKIKGEGGTNTVEMVEYLGEVIKRNSEMKAELIKEKQDKLGKVIWNVEVMRKRLRIQEKSEVLEDLHKRMEIQLQGVERQLKALELMVQEDMQQSEGPKGVKRDVLAQLIETVREDLVRRVEGGMKAVTQYVQEVMESGGNWEKEKEFEELKEKGVKLEAQVSEQQVQLEQEAQKVLKLQKNIKTLTQRKKDLKASLTVLKKEKDQAETFIAQVERLEPAQEQEAESNIELQSVKSEDWGATFKAKSTERRRAMMKTLDKYQALLLGWKQ